MYAIWDFTSCTATSTLPPSKAKKRLVKRRLIWIDFEPIRSAEYQDQRKNQTSLKDAAMKKLTALILLLSFINCYAEDKIFLSCRGTLTNSITKMETGKTEFRSTNTTDIITEIIVDINNNSMKVQLPSMNLCYGNDKCDCKFSEASFECKDQISASMYSSHYRKMEISRKSGFAIFTASYTSNYHEPQFFSLSIDRLNGQMQCTTMTKNIF
jgi:hypothetical protein